MISLLFASLLLSVAEAGDSPTPICSDIVTRARARNTTADDVASWIRKDDRNYAPGVAECLCVFNVHPAIHREARRHIIRDGIAEDEVDFTVHTADPLTSPTFQIATFVGKRLEDASGRQQPFVIIPTRLDAPRWFDIGGFVTNLRDFEVPGARMPDVGWWRGMGIGSLPSGPLPELLAQNEPSVFDLSDLVGTVDRALYLQLSEEDDESARMVWALYDITGRPPYRELSRATTRLLPDGGAVVNDCAAPSPLTSRRWKNRIAWPASRVATTSTGLALLTGFGVAALHQFIMFQQAPPGDPRNQQFIDRNVGFGAAAIAGGVVGATGLAIPGKLWRR